MDSDKTDIDISVAAVMYLISSQYTKEITIKFRRKCFKGKVVRVDGFRPEFKAIYRDSEHRIDSVKDGDGYTDDCFEFPSVILLLCYLFHYKFHIYIVLIFMRCISTINCEYRKILHTSQ